MMSRRLRLTMVVAVLVLAGCAHLEVPSDVQVNLLQEYQQVRSCSVSQCEAMLKEREQLYGQSPTGINRLRLALVTGFGKGAGADPKRALQLFDESIKSADATHDDEGRFAEVFASVLRERLQLEAKVGNAEARSGVAEARLGAAEAKVNTLEAKLGGVTRQLENERSRADELEKKLEALKDIEKSLRKR